MKYLILLLIGLLSCQPATNDTTHEIIVIGGGLMGSASAWQLSKQANQVILFEKQDSIYTHGSSFGEARIARSNNRNNDIWSYMHNTSVNENIALIDFLNENENNSHSIEDIYTTSPVSYVGKSQIYDKLYASLIRQKVDFKIANSKSEGKILFDVNLPEDVLLQKEYNKHSGLINPHAQITKLHQAISKKGNQVKYNHKVLSIEKKEDFYHLTTLDSKTKKQRSYQAKKIVCAAGPYTSELLQDIAPYFKKLVNPQRVFLAFLRINPESYHSFTEVEKEKLNKAYPVINSSTGTKDGSFFSMIEYFDQDGAPVIKIGGHFQRSDIEDLETVWKIPLNEKEIKWSMDGTLRYMDLLNLPILREDLELVDQYSCVYSLTDSEIPIVSYRVDDELKIDSNFVVLAGLSGVGAKGAMTYGMMAANLINKAVEKDSMYKVSIEAMGINRLLSDIKDLKK